MFPALFSRLTEPGFPILAVFRLKGQVSGDEDRASRSAG